VKILVLNCGSSSLKYQLIDRENDEVLASGKYERIGEKEAFLTHKAKGKKVAMEKPADDHKEAIEFTLAQFTNPEYAVVESLDEIGAIGHRVVHGGEIFKSSAVIDEKVIGEIESCSEFAPLHNPAAVLGMRACQKVMPGKPMVAVFDTTFHQTMSKEKYLYAIPYEFYQKYGVRKYGAHGTSHQYVAGRLAKLEQKPLEAMKIVTCHLGQGSSICAIQGGKSIDTSMGLTPLGGVPMVTRSGDLDPSVLTYLMKKENFTPQEMEDLLNKQSGLSAIAGEAPDFRVIEEKANQEGGMAKTAIDEFNYAIAGYIVKYAVAMGGIDYLIFTGGIGENQINIRRGIIEKLAFMGVEVDVEANNMRGEEKVISTENSKVKIYVIPTNEELMIAKETEQLL
jgi:acetate kinase